MTLAGGSAREKAADLWNSFWFLAFSMGVPVLGFGCRPHHINRVLGSLFLLLRIYCARFWRPGRPPDGGNVFDVLRRDIMGRRLKSSAVCFCSPFLFYRFHLMKLCRMYPSSPALVYRRDFLLRSSLLLMCGCFFMLGTFCSGNVGQPTRGGFCFSPAWWVYCRWEWSTEAHMMLGRLALWKGALLISRTHAFLTGESNLCRILRGVYAEGTGPWCTWNVL